MLYSRKYYCNCTHNESKRKRSTLLFMMITVLSTCVSAIATTVELPVVFTASPSFPQTVDQGGLFVLHYTISNNTPVKLPLSFLTFVTGGTLLDAGGTCGTALGKQSSCNKNYVYMAPNSAGTQTGSIVVNYNSRYSLRDDSLKFVVSS